MAIVAVGTVAFLAAGFNGVHVLHLERDVLATGGDAPLARWMASRLVRFLGARDCWRSRKAAGNVGSGRLPQGKLLPQLVDELAATCSEQRLAVVQIMSANSLACVRSAATRSPADGCDRISVCWVQIGRRIDRGSSRAARTSYASRRSVIALAVVDKNRRGPGPSR